MISSFDRCSVGKDHWEEDTKENEPEDELDKAHGLSFPPHIPLEMVAAVLASVDVHVIGVLVAVMVALPKRPEPVSCTNVVSTSTSIAAA